MAKYKIVTAHAYSSKYKTYVVGAYVHETLPDGLPGRDTFKVLFNYAIDEDRETARREAIARIYKDNARHPADMPVETLGRVSMDILQGCAF